jgi:hypothetical protein
MRSSFPKLVSDELSRARSIHRDMASMHEAYAIVLEAVDELKAEVWGKRSQHNHRQAVRDLVQVAAMCQRFAEDVLLSLVEETARNNVTAELLYGIDESTDGRGESES